MKFYVSFSVAALLLAAGSFAVAQTKPFNSSYDEQAPFLTKDGSTLYFTVAGNAQNAGGKRDPGDIWVSSLTATGWSRPEPVTNLNNSGYNAVAGLSADGSKLYLYGHYREDGSAALTQGISVSKRTGAGWTVPENIYLPYFVNKSIGSGAWLTSDESALIYSANAPVGYGAEDLYISILGKEGWSEPIHLGRAVNSEFQELTPSISEDGKTLYFSSNRPGSRGSFDVFFSERLDDSWLNWSEAKPLPGTINTAGRELFYYPQEPDRPIYTSTVDSDGYGDIKIQGPDVAPVTPEIPALQNQTPAPIPAVVSEPDRPAKGLIRINGLVISSDKSLPLPAMVLIRGGLEKDLSADSKGSFSIEVSQDINFVLEADYKGFISKSQKIDLSQAKKQILDVTMVLQPAAEGTVVTLSNVLFYQSSASLTNESYDELDMIVTFMKVNPDIKIKLAGHTDNRGDRNLNLRLSNERVKKVKGYLVGKGIEPGRISGQGFGGTKPVADNKTEEGRKLNRRVEFTIIR